ncbi:hypothetical protein N1851_009262 [Merluccius polli]|uniref:Secreted protein n=1 Tax=Merluccius polli TaxID=89951 RepID=A0AA47N150_MERPO|nr:hypothetical protein N1851_009262 [Merluccius polli]
MKDCRPLLLLVSLAVVDNSFALPDSGWISWFVLVTTGSMRWYLQPTQVAQSQEHGGDTRRPAVTRGELDRVVEGHQHNSRTGIYSFVREGTGGALPEPYKMTSSRLLACMCLTQLSETDSMRVA